MNRKPSLPQFSLFFCLLRLSKSGIESFFRRHDGLLRIFQKKVGQDTENQCAGNFRDGNLTEGYGQSADTGNQVSMGTDGGLFVPASAVVTVVSADTGNIITEGTDEGALLKLASSNNAAMLDTNGALIVPLDCGVIE